MQYYMKAIAAAGTLAVLIAARYGLDISKEVPLVLDILTAIAVPLIVFLVPNKPVTPEQVQSEAEKVSEADANIHSRDELLDK